MGTTEQWSIVKPWIPNRLCICIESMVSWPVQYFSNFSCFNFRCFGRNWFASDGSMDQYRSWPAFQRSHGSKRLRNWCNKDCIWLDEGRCVPGPQELRYEDRCSVMLIAAHFSLRLTQCIDKNRCTKNILYIIHTSCMYIYIYYKAWDYVGYVFGRYYVGYVFEIDPTP